MSSILVILAHPNFAQSTVNQALIDSVSSLKGVKVHDLYESYPDGIIDIEAEKDLLSAADLVVFQHPFYWYSAPALLKEWQDLVLQFNFAYGPEGHALKDKQWLSVISTGADADAYQANGHNRFTMRELLRPFEQTAFLCGMKFLPPMIVHNAREVASHAQTMNTYAQNYAALLSQFQKPDFVFDYDAAAEFDTMNQIWEL